MEEANSSSALSSSFVKQVYLYDWWLIKVQIGHGNKQLGVGGFTAKERPDGRVYHSTTIAKRQNTVTLVSVDGITILLSGFINRCRTLQNGFSSEVCKQFLLGFPHNWEESAALSFGESTNEDAAFGISDFSESANASAGRASSLSVSVDHLPANVLRDLLISGAGDAESGMLRKSIFNEIVEKYGKNAFNVDEASSLNQKSGNQATTQSPSLNGSPSQKKKAKRNQKQEYTCISDAKSGKEDLQEATPEDMPEKSVLDRLLHKSGGDASIVGEKSHLNQKSGNQVTIQSPLLNEGPSKQKKAKTNRKQEDSCIPDAKSGKDDLQEATPKDVPEKRVSDRLLHRSGDDASIVGENSRLNRKIGNQVTAQSPSLKEHPSKKKKAKTNRKQHDSCMPDAKSGKDDLQEATPKDVPEKRVSDRLLHKGGGDASIVGENSCLNQKSGNQVISRGPSLYETPPQKKKTATNSRKEDDNHVPDAQCRKEVLRKCNDESGADIDKNRLSSSPLTRGKKFKVYQKQEEKRDVLKVVYGQGDFGEVNTTSSSNGPLTRSRAKKQVKRTSSSMDKTK